MKFIDKEHDPDLFYRKASEDGKVEIGVYPVIFGFRIRAGYVGNMCYELDYCAGADTTQVELIYSLVLTALQNDIPFKEFPVQNVKPMMNDPICFRSLIELIGKSEITKVKTPEIHTMKQKLMREQLGDIYDNIQKAAK